MGLLFRSNSMYLPLADFHLAIAGDVFTLISAANESALDAWLVARALYLVGMAPLATDVL